MRTGGWKRNPAVGVPSPDEAIDESGVDMAPLAYATDDTDWGREGVGASRRHDIRPAASKPAKCGPAPSLPARLP